MHAEVLLQSMAIFNSGSQNVNITGHYICIYRKPKLKQGLNGNMEQSHGAQQVEKEARAGESTTANTPVCLHPSPVAQPCVPIKTGSPILTFLGQANQTTETFQQVLESSIANIQTFNNKIQDENPHERILLLKQSDRRFETQTSNVSQ
nr:hypothetical protein BgiMline_011771 [Biomphalaria glabrata]